MYKIVSVTKACFFLTYNNLSLFWFIIFLINYHLHFTQNQERNQWSQVET